MYDGGMVIPELQRLALMAGLLLYGPLRSEFASHKEWQVEMACWYLSVSKYKELEVLPKGCNTVEHAHEWLNLVRWATSMPRPQRYADLAAFWRDYEAWWDSVPLYENAQAANPYGCNGYGHKQGCPHKGTTREHQTKGTPRRVYKVDQSQPMHKQVNALADAIERAARDGARLEAVIYRPEFGELTLDCGNPGRKNDSLDSRGHGVQHALEERHGISARDIAETLLRGNVKQKEDKPSRLEIGWQNYLVVLEREMKQDSGRISKTRVKLHTAMKQTK